MAREVERSRRDLARMQAEADAPYGFFVERIGQELLHAHPCETARREFDVTLVCRCGAQRSAPMKRLLGSRLAHAPWSRVWSSLTCAVCASAPERITFAKRDNQTLRMVSYGSIEWRRLTQEEVAEALASAPPTASASSRPRSR